MIDLTAEMERAEADLKRHINSMAASSSALLRSMDAKWPCGHIRSPVNEHWIAGRAQCKACRRKRWNRHVRILQARKLADRFIPENIGQNGRLPADMILSGIARDFGMTIAEMRGKTRKADHVAARSVFVRIMLDRGLSTNVAGKLLGGRDHSTVLNSRKKYRIYERRDPRVSETYHRWRDAA